MYRWLPGQASVWDFIFVANFSRSFSSFGGIWDYGREAFGDALNPDVKPGLFEDCETGEDAEREWARAVFEKAVKNLHESPPNSPKGRVSRYRINREMT